MITRQLRWRTRWQRRLDRSWVHQRWMMNGPLWWVCPLCRSLGRDWAAPSVTGGP